MRKSTTARVLKFQAIIITVALLGAASCKSYQAPDTRGTAEDQNKDRFDDKSKERDAQFLVDATTINLEQISLGKLAQEKGDAGHVRDMGSMMRKSHEDYTKELSELADKKMVSVPKTATDSGKDAYEKLNGKSGKDFDAEYADMLVDSHKEAIGIYEKASQDSADLDVRAWASRMLPSMRSHLNRAMECQEKTDK